MFRMLALTLFAVVPFATLSGCAGGIGADASSQALPIRGSLTYQARSALPPDAMAVVELRDTTSGEGPVVAEQRIALGGRQVPIPFDFAVDRAKLAEGRAFSVRGGVLAGSRPMWASDPVRVDTRAARVDVGTLTMQPVRAEAFQSTLRCGTENVTIGYTQTTMRMTVGGETFDMRPVRTASSAKHEAVGDPSTWFWSKGNSAMVAVRGRDYPPCTVVRAGSKPFRATGNEPGWRLDIAGGQMSLIANYGNTRLTVPAPVPETVPGGMRYRASTSEGPLVATVLDRRCADTMTGMPHPNSVVLELAGRTLNGCGGDPASLLQGRDWVVEDINRTGMIDRSRVTLSFGADGQLVGLGSCNTYIARYALSGEGLAITRPASTMKACPPALMKQEDLFFDVLAKTQRFEINPNGTLILWSADGRSITARRL